MVNTNYASDLIATTMEVYYKDRPSDAVFGELALIAALKRGKKISKQGGIKILVPVMYRASTAVGSYSGWDQLDVSPQEGLTNAEFNWKFYFGTVSIDNPTLLQNRGESAQLMILKNRIAQAEMSLADAMNADLFGDGTGNSSKDVTGLAIAVDSAGTYGNISRTSYAYWAAQETAVSGALAIGGASGMRRMFNDCALGPTRMTPNLIMTTQAVFEGYEALMDPYMRYTVIDTSKPNAVYSKQSLMFRDAELMWDDYCTSGVAYFLNTKTFALIELEGRGAGLAEQGEDRDTGSFRLNPFQTPINQDAKIAQFFWGGNLVCDAPFRNGKLTGLTNA